MNARSTTWVVILLAGVLGGCGDSNEPADGRDAARDDSGGGCTEGTHRCVGTDGTIDETCTGGAWGGGVLCEETGRFCEDGFGCVLCDPNATRCEGNDAMVCADDGSAWELSRTCDVAAGEACDPVSGVCINPCARAAGERSNIGCEYWAVDLDNAENSMAGRQVDHAANAQYAVVVANLSDTYASDVVIDRDLALPGEPHELEEVDRATLDPGDLVTFYLARWDVDGDNPAGVDNDPQTGLSRRVYRIRSSIPVVAYQFNPIEQAFSNAAAVLLPTTALDLEYYGLVWPPANPIAMAGFFPYPNRTYVTIVGVEDGTTVRVTPSYDIFAGVGQTDAGILAVDAILAGTETTFTLDQFDVLNLENEAMHRVIDPLPDLSGTIVRSDRPVAVFMGNDLAVVGGETMPDGSTDNCCAEHMEAQVPPTSSLGTRFVVSRSPIRSSNPAEWTEWDYYRVLAVRDGTHVTTTADEARDFTLDAGEWLEFKSREGFIVQSEPAAGITDPRPVIVAQYIVSQQQCYNWRPEAGGDADMVYIPPVEQRRNTYIFATGEGFSENWAVVSMPEGTSATIDGNDVATTCTPSYVDGDLLNEGTSIVETYRAYHCEIEDGRHDVTSDGVVGVMVFGYYAVGSYQYPAGSEMRRIFFG